MKFLYKILNQRIGEEVKEGYTVSNIFLLVNGGMAAIVGTLVEKSKNPFWIFYLSCLGIVIAVLWYRSVKAHYRWKNNLWLNEVKELEKRLYDKQGDLQVWNKILDKAHNLVRPGSVLLNIKYLSIVFIIFWAIIAILYLHLSSPFIFGVLCK